MASSRKSTSRNKRDSDDCRTAFERALGAILARVSALTGPARPALAVAYSGGVDSSVLLHLAARAAHAHGLALHVFHVHHGLSRNADAWSAHCRDQAQACRLPFDEVRVKLPARAAGGVEEAARSARYAALGELCRRHGVALLLTAHHQDDQAETVLLQLMRGAGLPGLSGMAEFQPAHELLGPGVALGRPLLAVRRAALEQEAGRLGLQHVIDESNRDTRFRRNALRQDVTPLLERHFPGFAAMVGRSASHAQDAQALLEDLAAIDLAQCADEEGGRLMLAPLAALPAPRIDNLLRVWLRRQGVSVPSTARLQQVRRQMLEAGGDLHPFFDFGPVRLHRIAGRLELHPNLGMPPAAELPLQWRGHREIALPQWHGRLVFENSPGGIDPQLLRSGPLVLRPRSGRERLKTAPNRPSRSLKNLFQESAIAPWRRTWLPLLYLDRELVFVAGLGMDVRHVAAGDGIALRWEFTA